MSCRFFSRATLFVLCCLLTVTPLLADEEWSRFRGPNGEGISTLQGVPATWTEADFEWTLETPGKCTSSPVLWGEKLFTTGGEANGTRTLYCVHGVTGKILWQEKIQLGTHALHVKNSFAAGSPAVDKDRVYVSFADESHCLVKAYTHAGELVWTRDFGSQKHQHGSGMSPVIYHDLVIFMNDQEGPSATFALDAQTGETRWSQPRAATVSSYSAPQVVKMEGRDQLILLSKAIGLSGSDPLTGKQLWASGPLPLRTVASPMSYEGLFFATCGEAGRGVHMISFRPGASSGSPPVTTERRANLPYVPTPIVLGQYLYLWNDDGIVCCVDLKGDFTQNVWRERIGGTYSGSPIVVGGKMYCIAEDGTVGVVDASPQFKSYGKSPLGEVSYSTPAVGNGRMYLRGVTKLVSLKAKP